jgi:hypothetical protein
MNDNLTIAERTSRLLSSSYFRKLVLPVVAAGLVQFGGHLSPEVSVGLASTLAAGVSLLEDKLRNQEMDSGGFMRAVGRAALWGAAAGGVTAVGNIPAVDTTLGMITAHTALALRSGGHLAGEGVKNVAELASQVSPAVSQGVHGMAEWGKSLTEFAPKFASIPLSAEQSQEAYKFWTGLGFKAFIGACIAGAGWVATTPRPPAN